jgi:pimeloyl-ACP methyl ester carboxylesterase
MEHLGKTSTIVRTREVRVNIGDDWLIGDLGVPPGATAIVVFAHGSGSGRMSPRNQFVAAALDQRRLATLLIDLLTQDEELVDRRTGHLRFNVRMLAERLVKIADWVHGDEELNHLPIGLFGASTGGGAALIAAAKRPERFGAVVSRGGRPDLAGSWLRHVLAPTLLIVGERDEPVIHMNEQAMAQMHAEVRLEIVPGATHLFEEPGALEHVAALAGQWFETHLGEARL